MPMHRYHPGGADPEDAIFFDDCAECSNQAEQPIYYLDPTKMKRLWDRMIEVETGTDESTQDYRTQTEAIACKSLWPTYLFIERFTMLSPKQILGAINAL